MGNWPAAAALGALVVGFIAQFIVGRFRVPLIALVANAWSGMLGLPHLTTATMLKHGVGRILFSILPGSFWSGGTELNLSDNQQPGELLHQLDPSVSWQVMGTLEMWIGVVVGIGLIVLAGWMRQRRIETST